MRVILASKSPRRRELLKNIFSEFEIIVSEADETVPEGLHPREAVDLLSLRKGAAVARDNPDALVISSDTLVELDGVALGKPSDAGDAERMLSMLSGRGHNVHTGVAVHYKGRAVVGHRSTEVVFLPLSEERVRAYVATGEPMDKAGAYGIQGFGGALVKEYHGDFDTVVGLSVSLTKELIEEAVKDND